MSEFIEVFDWMDSDECRFSELPLNLAIRQSLPSYRMHDIDSPCTYDDSYGEIFVMFQPLVDNLYWVYIRDYRFGHIKVLGKGIYEYDPEDFDDDVYDDVKASVDIQRRIQNGEIDLDEELYNYYHILPEGTSLKWFYPGETFSLEEAVEVADVSPMTIKRLINERKLEGFHGNSEIRITKESVLKLMDSKR